MSGFSMPSEFGSPESSWTLVTMESLDFRFVDDLFEGKARVSLFLVGSLISFRVICVLNFV